MQQDMTTGRILPVILRFTLPLFIGNIFQQFYSMADTIIVGRYLGAAALAAVGATSTVSFLLLGFAMGLSSGFAVLTAQQFGARDPDGVRISVSNGIQLAVLLSAALTALGLLVVPGLLVLMHTPADILADATKYMLIICRGLAASMFYNLFSSFLRSVGNSRAPLFFLIFSSCLNIFLDIFFIVRMGMGVDGAAVATVLSQGLSAALCLLYILLRVHVLVPSRRHWGFHREATLHQLRMGIPMALQFSVTASGTIVMQAAINMFGSVAVAAFTAAWRIQNPGGSAHCRADRDPLFGRLGRCRRGFPPSDHAPVFLCRLRPAGPHALGDDLHCRVRSLFYSAEFHFYFPQRHAGMQLFLPASHGRRHRNGCPGPLRDRRNLFSQLSAFRRLRRRRLAHGRGVHTPCLPLYDAAAGVRKRTAPIASVPLKSPIALYHRSNTARSQSSESPSCAGSGIIPSSPPISAAGSLSGMFRASQETS